MADNVKNISVKKWARITGVSALAVVVVFVSGLLYLNSDSGRSMLTNYLNETISTPDSTFEISGIDGSLFSTLEIPSLSVSDTRGKWLEVVEVSIEWSPMSLLSGTFSARNINAKSVTLLRMPEPSKSANEDIGEPFALPSLPIDIEIDHFGISTILTGQDLVETAPDFSLGGALRLTNTEGAEAKLELLGNANNSDRISLDVTYPQNGSNLDTDFVLFAPQGGLLEALSGLVLKKDLNLTLTGTGPINNWMGSGHVTSGNEEISTWQISNNDQGLSIESSTDPSMFLPVDFHSLAGSPLSVEMTMRPVNNENDQFISGQFYNDVAKISLTSSINLEDSPKIGETILELETISTSPINDLIAPASIEPLIVKVTLSDILSTPYIQLSVSDAQISISDQVEMTLDGDVMAIVNDTIRITTAGDISNLRGSAIAGTGELLNTPLHWNVESTYIQQAGQVRVESARLTHDEFEVSAVANYGTSNGSLTANIDAALSSLESTMQKLDVGFELAGNASTRIDVSQTSTNAPLQATVSVTAEKIETENETLNLLIGSTPGFSGEIEQATNGVLHFSDVRFFADMINMNATGRLTAEQNLEATSFMFNFQNLEKLVNMGGPTIAGDLTIDGRISGNVTSPNLEIATGFNALDIQGVSLKNFEAHAELSDLANNLNGEISASSSSNLGPLQLEVSVARDEEVLNVRSILATLGNYNLAGELQLPTSSPITGDMALTTTEDKDHPSIINGDVSLNALFSDNNGLQNISINGEVSEIVYTSDPATNITVDAATINGDILFTETSPEITLNADISNLNHPDISASNAAMEINQVGDATAFVITADGTDTQPYAIEINGDFTVSDEAQLVNAALTGTIAETPIGFDHDGAIQITSTETQINGYTVGLGDGTVSGSAHIANDNITANIEALNADLRPLMALMPDIPLMGILNGSADFRGTPKAPASQFDFTLSEIIFDEQTGIAPEDLTVSLNGNVSDEVLKASGDLIYPGQFNANFNATVPLHTEAGLSVSQTAPLSGEVEWNGEIGSIWPALKLIDHDLSGSLDGTLTLSGNIETPDIDGSLSLSQGRYENMQTGFVATDIDMLANIENRKFMLERFSASDGEDGTIAANADVTLNPDYSFYARTELKLLSAKLVRQPELSIEATTDLTFIKNDIETSLRGDIIVDRADIGAIEQGGPSITTLNVTEINGESIAGDNGPEEDALGPIDLDLSLDVPGQLFVRSFGLDSEWQADLTVTGTSENPIVAGSAEQIRGFFEFSGKRFDLTRGSFSFPGDATNDPIIEIMAEHQLTDMTANLRIYGRASNPSLEMSSTPYLPENEVMARILFGTSVADLTAVEAVQLASAVHSLSNGGGQGLMGGIRRAIGVDRLSIDNDASREYGTTITGGKYLTDNVYVEVSTAPATGQTATSVEVGLTRNLSLVTRRTLDHDNNLSIRWSWNY